MWIFDRAALRRLREERGLSLAAFGKLIGMRAQQVDQLEKGPGLPTVRTLLRIINALGVELNYFFVKNHDRDHGYDNYPSQLQADEVAA